MTVLVRSATLSTFEVLAKGLGLDVSKLLLRFGIPRQALHDPDMLIPYQGFINLLEYSAALGQCPDLGLQLAQARGISILGPISVLLRHADTVGDALALASRYIFVHSPALKLETRSVPGSPDLIDIVFDITHANLIARPQVTSLALGIVCQGLKVLTAGRLQARQVTLPHAPVALEEAYRQAYSCPVKFLARDATVRLRRSDLAFAIPENDPQMKELALGYLEQLGGKPQALLSDRVRRLVRNFLSAGHARHADIARALSVHPRTLQRRLAAEGVTFESLLDEVRKAQFLELTGHHAGPGMTQIAHILGYAEVSVLTRSCKRWFGATPREMRKKALRNIDS
ncbi:AraC family transcriptional regulator [Pseudoduganella violaceinigra]|uniref:AraC family transcriptional regulator n=1 Tax=Pseudoduganella violaceinigra TaxID=246602 RepID=UPI00041A46C4|nr:AraC family transcriptional regulator [Pseudoduganella violaceinigra]